MSNMNGEMVETIKQNDRNDDEEGEEGDCYRSGRGDAAASVG